MKDNLKEQKNSIAISVIMGAWNDAKYLPMAIESILKQTFRDLELIVINDGSDDNTNRIVHEYCVKDSRIKVIENEKKTGLTHALNQGIGIARGKYVARLDSDDIALPNRLQCQFDYMESHEDVFLCATEAEMIDSEDNLIEKIKSFGINEEEIERILPKRNCIVHSSIMFRNESLSYREKFYYSQDYDLYLRLLSAGKKVRKLPEILVKWRAVPEGRTYLRREKQKEFLKMAQLFYEQRKSAGKDRYENFDEQKILQKGDVGDNNVLIVEDRMTEYLKSGNYKAARKLFWKDYLYIRGIKMLSKFIPFFIFTSLPFSYKIFRAVFYKERKITHRKILGLFFTENVSLRTWHEKGMLTREKLIYEKILQEGLFDEVFWFTYGSDDAQFAENLKEDKKLDTRIIVIQKPKIFSGRLCSFVYSFLLPFIYCKHIRKCNFLKTNQMWGGWSAIIAKFLFRKKLLLRTGYTLSLFGEKNGKNFYCYIFVLLEKIAYRFSDFSVVASKKDREYVLEKYKPKNVELNYNYVDTKLFRPLQIENKKGLIFVGRLSKQKNLKNLVEAVSQTKLELDIYGEGELKDDISDQIKDLGIEDQIKLCGNVSNDKLPEILNQYKIFVLLSLYEGMPKSLLEAMSCGIACIGTDVEGINEVIENKKDGILTGVDPRSILGGIRLLMSDSEMREHLGKNARLKIEEKFSLDAVFKKEKEIYEKMA